MTLTLDQIWSAALGELGLRMTKATFVTWVAGTEALQWEDGTFVVGVADAFKRDWLDNRLKATIERTLQGIVGQPVRVTFLVTESPLADHPAGPKPQPDVDMVAVRFYGFNPKGRGWLMLAKYDLWFWQPFLGCIPFSTYQFLRSLDKQNEGWGAWHFVSIERIAATLGVGRQAITGVKRRKQGGEYWQRGALDGLQDAGIARIETLGSGGKNVSYRISCLNELPLLVPGQVETLPEILQLEHAEFLKEASIEYEEWEQLTLPSLVR